MPLERFLERHWQRRPLVARGAAANAAADLRPEDLAGLACIDGVTSRLVVHSNGTDGWRMRHGPFDDSDFADLPERRWTLLVQEVDRWLPSAARLLDEFRFMPNWRLDDLMVSYATDEGGVGPHVDRYDVFLVQLQGRRRWGFDHEPLAEERIQLVPELDLRVLAEFEPDESVVLDPGDVLYLPPGVAHDGVALEPGMTASIGFRAPSAVEIVTAIFPALVSAASDGPLADDPRAGAVEDPGQISPATIDRMRSLVHGIVDRALADGRWAGRLMTDPPRELPGTAEPPDWRECLNAGGWLRRVGAPLFCWSDDANGVRLYVGGQDYELDPALRPAAQLLCGTERLDERTLGPYLGDASFGALLEDVCGRGFLLPEDPAAGDHL